MEVYRDTNGNGIVDAGEPIEGTSGQGTTDFEQVTLGPDPSGRYILRVVNYAAAEPYDVTVTFTKPTFTAAQRENWSLSCETFGGAVLDRREVFVARGDTANVSLSACASALKQAFATGEGCDAPTGRARGRRLDRVRLGGLRDVHLRAYKIGRKQPRKGIDRFCLSDARGVRVGYSTKRFRAKLGRQARRYARNKALLALTTSRRFRLRGMRVGALRALGAPAHGQQADRDRRESLVREARQDRSPGLQGQGREGPRDRNREQELHLEPGQDAQDAGRLAPGLKLAWGYVWAGVRRPWRAANTAPVHAGPSGGLLLESLGFAKERKRSAANRRRPKGNI